ncbi:MAG: hypothetical protein HYV16_13555 [Gammaproteobacteria bacterium]|nr:hypothetical protein [Gammaproteobacteria bacterium]
MTRLPRLSLLSLTLGSALFSASALADSDSRRFEKDFSAEDIKLVRLDGGVGEIRVKASDDERIHVSVKVDAQNKSWFSKDVELDEVELKAEEDGDSLQLSVEGEDIGEDWELALPAGMALDIDHGVGEVRVEGVSGDIAVDLGVGELDIEAEEKQLGQVMMDVGVGDADIRGGKLRSRKSGMPLAQEMRYEGEGEQEVRVELGVGDAKLSLR